MQDLPGDQEGGQGQAEEEIVVRRGVRSPEEQGRLQAEVPPRDLVLDRDEEPHRLREGPGGQGQIDGAHAQAEGPEPVADGGGDDHARRDAHENRRAEVQAQERGGIGADPREGVMGERELASVACEEVPAHGQDDVIEAHRIDVHVVLGGGKRQPRERGVGQERPPEPPRESRHRSQAPRSASRTISRSWSAKSRRGPSRRTCPRSSM